MVEQRRRFMRLIEAFEVEYEIVSDLQVNSQFKSQGKTQTIDISAGGMRVLSMNAQPKGTRIKFKLMLLAQEDPLYLIGKVVWSRISAQGTKEQSFELGIEFEQINLAQKKRIIKYVYDKLREKRLSKNFEDLSK